MRIDFHFIHAPDGTQLAVHFIETSDALSLETMKALKAGILDLQASGWGGIAQHPLYTGLTFWDVVQAEIVRLNDVPARTALGI